MSAIEHSVIFLNCLICIFIVFIKPGPRPEYSPGQPRLALATANGGGKSRTMSDVGQPNENPIRNRLQALDPLRLELLARPETDGSGYVFESGSAAVRWLAEAQPAGLALPWVAVYRRVP